MSLLDHIEWHMTAEQLDSEDMFDGYLLPMGFYLLWAFRRDLLSEACLENAGADFAQVEAGEYTCRDLVDFAFEGKLADVDLTEEGLNFTRKYYVDGTYLTDLAQEFSECDHAYAIPDTPASARRAGEVIERRFQAWVALTASRSSAPVVTAEWDPAGTSLRLSAQRALLGVVRPGLRSVSVAYAQATTSGAIEIAWKCVFDSEPAKEAGQGGLSRAASELLADFPGVARLHEEYLVAAVDQEVPHLEWLVFAGWEPAQ